MVPRNVISERTRATSKVDLVPEIMEYNARMAIKAEDIRSREMIRSGREGPFINLTIIKIKARIKILIDTYNKISCKFIGSLLGFFFQSRFSIFL